jgi:ribosomal protein L11 methyltransferase
MVENAPAANHMARLATDRATAQQLADFLAESLDDRDIAVATFESEDGRWTMALHFPEPPNETAVRALVALHAGAELANTLVFERIEAKDWVAASLQALPPVEAGRFLVHGRHDRAQIRANRIGIEIEAALAFGTGHHGTTRGCLLALDGLAKHKSFHLSQRSLHLFPAGRGRPRSGRVSGFRQSRGHEPPHPNPLPHGEREKRVRGIRILDVGTGTGVLAIAAAKALKTAVLASDNDPLAVFVARENARANQAAALVEIIQATGLDAHRFRARGPFDLILANILLGPLMRLARPMRSLLAPGGRVVLSGLLTNQAQPALVAYRAQGLVLERRIMLEGWTTLVLRRPI